MKSVEELLVPRFKVEFADYPDSLFTQGQVIEFELKKEMWYRGVLEHVSKPINFKDGRSGQMSFFYFEKYPKVFRLMDWHEERAESDMPEYVKRETMVKKVFKHFTYILNSGNMAGEHEASAVCSFEEASANGYENLSWRYDTCQPATFQEYEQQNKKTNNT